jgi:hypothetical protein
MSSENSSIFYFIDQQNIFSISNTAAAEFSGY